MKNLSFLCSGVLTTCLALATTACSDNSADRTDPGTSGSTRSETSYNGEPATGMNAGTTGTNSGVAGTNSGTTGTTSGMTDSNASMTNTNSSVTGSSSGIGGGSGDASSEYMLDPTGSGTGE